MTVTACPNMRRLPLELPIVDGEAFPPPNLEHIYVEDEKWWESLEWDQPGSKIALQPFCSKLTRSLFGNAVVPLSLQIQQFNTVIGNITQVRGPKATAKILSKALYIFCFGANEFFDYMRAKNNTPKEEFVAGVQSAYHVHLKDVYNMGARKFGIIGVPPIGCCPYARAIYEKEGGEGCMQLLNDFAQVFYNSTLTLLQRMTSELPNLKYSLGNTYAMTMDLFDNYPSFGFKNIKTACCGLGNYNGEVGCYEPINPILCSNRSEYLFWDLYHPSQAASQLLAPSQAASPNYTQMNFSQLADVQEGKVGIASWCPALNHPFGYV
ncbi:GDSL esterase/lipase At1g29660 [Jatropha curcas]|uniref:GDSL esterase/lipase At1g29660 n=1 Tax=Jatropha curcas TaxID=180498 RepID=UPI0018933168|nr:GDSL esterase/lipase At1g29660 [Jatropha curcas]